jgi:adenosylcobyric acid synthase
MTAKVIMVQGTASSVGKSVLVTALCRIFKQDFFKVAPFKSQNMALNSFVTKDGGEIGRAQAVQAEACGIEPTVEMNPILLKPESGLRSQIIVQGKVSRNLKSEKYTEYADYLMEIIERSLNSLRSQYDIVVIEGAGSTAEVNLREHEIVNMRIAKMAESPVLLVGDIDRGGIFASLVGTMELLSAEERNLVKGLIINKFRGEKDRFRNGVDFLESRTARPVLGIIPYFEDLSIAQEDSVYLDERPATSGEGLQVVIIRVPHTANYDDFDPLQEMGCNLRYVTRPQEVGCPDLLILPGTKGTIHDRLFLKEQGFDSVILELARKKVPVIGVCGGFQMLGLSIRDPQHVESEAEEVEGLGLLPVDTVFANVKNTVQVKSKIMADKGLLKGLKDSLVSGYEIHMGQTTNPEVAPLGRVIETPLNAAGYYDGCVSKNGLIFGTYLHGIFRNGQFTNKLLTNLWHMKGLTAKLREQKDHEEEYDKLAELVRQNLDVAKLYEIIGLKV